MSLLSPASIAALTGLPALNRVVQAGRNGVENFVDILTSHPSAPVPLPVSAPAAPVNEDGAITQFRELVRQRLQAAGLNPGNETVLRDDGLGGIRVEGDENTERAIERLLNDAPQVRRAFEQLVARYRSPGATSEPFQIALTSAAERRSSSSGFNATV